MDDDLYLRIWRLYYQCYYQELSSYELSRRYAVWDMGSSIFLLVAVFGSLGLGVAFWNDPEWRQIWITVTAVGSIISLGNLAFSVSKVKQDHISFFNEFSTLRFEIQSLMDNMKTGLIVDQREISEKTLKCDQNFRSIMSRTSFNLILFNKRFRKRLQKELDEILEKSGYHLGG